MLSKPEKYNILYLDDEQGNLNVFRTTFQRGFNIFLETSGSSALMLLQKERIDLIITDQRMPEMLGTEFLREAIKITPQCMRMVLTGYSDIDAIVASVNECGIYRYITKPWILPDLRAAINDALEIYQLRQDKEWLFEQLRQSNVALEKRVSEQVALLNEQKESLAQLNDSLMEANRRLISSEARYRGMADNLPNGFICLLNRNLVYTFVAGKELAHLGVTKEHFLDKPISAIYQPYLVAQQNFQYNKVFEGQSITFELPFMGQDYSISASPVLNSHGVVQEILAVAQNITERKRYQQEVENRRDFLNKIFSTIPCLLYLFDVTDFSVTYINQRIVNMLGYQPDDFYKMSANEWGRLVHPSDFRALVGHLRKAKKLRAQEISVIEYRLKHKNGHYVWMRSTATAFDRGENGEVTQLLSYIDDISRRKRAEHQLQENRDFLAQINNLSPNLIYLLDADTLDNVYRNRLFNDVFGYSDEEIESLGGTLMQAVTHPDDLKALMEDIRGLSSNAHASHNKDMQVSRVYRVRDADGNWRWLYSVAKVFKYKEDGYSRQLLFVSKDITDLKEAELAIKRSEERLKETQQLARLARWEFDIAKNTVKWYGDSFNPELLPQTGNFTDYQTYIQLMHPEDLPRFLEAQERLLDDGTPYEVELRYMNRSQKYAYLQLRGRPFHNEYGQLTRVVGSALDITKMKVYEERLQRINESKDRILATVAHDLRNPINNIQGLTSILRLQNASPSSMDEEIYSRIEQSCKKGLHLISELLEMGELESESFVMETESVPFDAFVQEVLAQFSESIQRKGIELWTKFNAEGINIFINKAKFTRVIDNLLTNAQKFTKEGGQITVGTFVKDERVHLLIADTGIGIPLALQPIIFEKFSKAGRTGLKGEKSTGLGMSIVKQIVDLHQGEIWLESEENMGTTFFIALKPEEYA